MDARNKRLSKNADIRRLLLLSAAVVVLFEICLTALNIVLEKFYTGAVGLDSLRTRAMLDTARMVFQELGIFLLPFWQIAVIRIAICKHRRRELDRGMLTFGFTRFGPVLVQNLLMSLVLVAACFACVQVASVLYTQTPRGQELGMYLTQKLPTDGDVFAVMEEIPPEELMGKMAPVLVLSAVLGLPALYFVWCKFRLAKYIIMDDDHVRALPAMLRSFRMTRRQFWNFLQMDLKLWWYYLAVLLATALGFAELLLPLAGLRIDANVLFYGSLVTSYVARLLVAWGLQYRAELTYAAFYDKRKSSNTDE